MENEAVYILTDCCMWEANKKNSTSSTHAIEVVDVKTGQVRFIESGSRISFVEGKISNRYTQEEYNRQTSEVPDSDEDELQRDDSETGSSKNIKEKTSNDESL